MVSLSQLQKPRATHSSLVIRCQPSPLLSQRRIASSWLIFTAGFINGREYGTPSINVFWYLLIAYSLTLRPLRVSGSPSSDGVKTTIMSGRPFLS